MNRFIGFLKMKKDPKVQRLTIDNVILRGSIIRNTWW